MSAWRIVAVAPVGCAEACSWEEAGDAANALAVEHGLDFELLMVGQSAPAGRGWPNLSRLTLARTAEPLETAAQVGAAARTALGDDVTARVILLPPGPFGEEIAADLSARLGAAALGNARTIKLADGAASVTRRAFGGRGEIALSYPSAAMTATMRVPSSEERSKALPAADVVDAGKIEPAKPAIARTTMRGRKTALEGARLVIAGGRGLDESGFALLEGIADAVGGAVAGSLPAVDAGLVAVNRQVGQSGKFVTPAMYVAVGLSGTPQHLAGIGSATRLVAINTDPAAPIFTYAELGAVADAKVLLPLLRDQFVAKAVR